MVTYPNCKINLGLHIVHRRDDGYHDIESIFLPVKEVCDKLEIMPIDNAPSGVCRFSQTGLALDNAPDDNLCVKAYRLMHNEFGDKIKGVEMTLDKRIPFGAGLGGGSADAAFVLKMLNDIFALGLNDDELRERAAKIGADCPFFIANRAAYVSGIGDILAPIDLDLAAMGLRIEIDKPDDYVSTKEAYAGVTPRDRRAGYINGSHNLIDAVRRPIEEWREILVNDFEKSIFHTHPAIDEAKRKMYERGAVYAAMSGSGSAVFGLFKTKHS